MGQLMRRAATLCPALRGGLVLAVLLVAGCGENEGAAPTPSEIAAPTPPDPARWERDTRQALEDDFATVYARLLNTQVEESPLRNLLLAFEEPVPMERRRFLAYLYGQRDFAPVFMADGRKTEVARSTLAFLQGVEAHALDPSHFVSEALVEAVAVQQQIMPAVEALPRLEPTREERRALVGLVDTLDGPGDDPAVAVLALGLGDDAPEELAELAAAHRQRVALERVARGNAALVEALLMDGALSYAFEQRNFNTLWVDEDLDDDGRHELIARRTEETFDALAAADSPEALQAVLDGLQPQHPQYAPLLAERTRYARFVEEGGWEPIEPRHVERGSSGDTVRQLQVRLAAEEYFDGEIDGVFGEELEEAVKAYQQTHQMEVTGESSRGFWLSINIPAEQRLAQIELTMQRWRESRIGDDEDYVLVNIPDFHAEVWRSGERAMRFRIVVGNTDQLCDPQTNTLKYANATPLQSAMMTYVVLNPMWNVPRRIVEEELLPALLEDPLYFETMGFERHTTDSGWEIVRQLPGPENPLGTVKFMFPNPHNTYMHDTSRPQYFRYPVRAFSHGCMRVQDPHDLLEHILREDGQWDEAWVERVFESQEETSVTLDTPLPVHIEYYVVRVDDDGRANFLADVYRLDRNRMNPPDANDLRCEPETGEPRLVLGEGDVVMFADDEGNRYTQDQWAYVQAGGTLEPGEEEGTFAPLPEGALDALTAVPEGSGEGSGDGGITAGDFGP